MSEINSVGSSFYFSSLQQANIKAEKNDKKEKVSSKKIKFSDILKKNENLSDFELQGFPPEIADLSIEDAALYLKDQVDIIGDKFAESQNSETVMEFKNAVQQFVRFVVINNFEVSVQSRRLRKPRPSSQNAFSPFSLPPTTEIKRVTINVINQKLDALTRDMLMNQQDNLKTLAQNERNKRSNCRLFIFIKDIL